MLSNLALSNASLCAPTPIPMLVLTAVTMQMQQAGLLALARHCGNQQRRHNYLYHYHHHDQPRQSCSLLTCVRLLARRKVCVCAMPATMYSQKLSAGFTTTRALATVAVELGYVQALTGAFATQVTLVQDVATATATIAIINTWSSMPFLLLVYPH